MIISTCGYGNTGASAVLDFLQGYSGLQRIADFEFQLFNMADGINDLKYAITASRERTACNAAVKRFERAALHGPVGQMMKKHGGAEYIRLTKEYIDSLIQVTWAGYNRYDPEDITNRPNEGLWRAFQRYTDSFLRKIDHRLHFPPYQTRYLALMDENRFVELTQRYFESCLKAVGLDPDKDILTDVLFSAMNPKLGTEYVKDPKIILVFRDPRDLYIRANEHQCSNAYFPCRDVDKFIKYYRTLMENLVPYEDSLTIQYEDLIYNYYPTTIKIMDYLGFSERPDNEFKYFNPDDSVKYTRAWETYKGHEADMEKIEQGLPEYLFNYTEYKKAAEQQKLFCGENK